MNHSLRRRLLVVLSVTVLAAWAGTAVFSYLDARRSINAMLDDHLRQAAELLRGQDPAVPAPQASTGSWVLTYQVHGADGRLLRRSPDAPEEPLAPAEGFSDVEREGERWRVFRSGTVQVAERNAFREALAGSVAAHLLHPLAVALPVLAVLIWLAVDWGLRPLKAFARAVERRTPDAVEPLDTADVPGEARPLAEALNALFGRVGDLLERERRFAGDAAHELRTPLTAIRTHAQVALSAPTDDEREHAIAGVLDGSDRAAHLVDQLLVLARLDPRYAKPPATSVRLAEVAARAVADLAPMAAVKDIDLGLSDQMPDAVMAGDPDLLGALARNLVDNAVRYTPAGGTVDVAVRRDGARIVLCVTDTGPGIPPAERNRVLDRFHRVLGTRETGSGLGLSIVAGIAALHRAALSLGDGPGGRGLAVTVAFPAP
ncbi:MAG TPA: ATP-binding protein [Azospirillum sp.]|nr:ATP-binding protein [Azospirillum sp.]